MSQIHELSEELTNQIAAGEVIERPASVIKELCENAIDAGSTRLRVSFEEAGLKKICVQDNGSGIAPDQLDLAFRRHATSKIKTQRDLFNILTLGFRGEALASIAAVAHVEILTATSTHPGVRALFSDGQKQLQESAAVPKGTKIVVQDLFYNTPARLKYLRTQRTEILKNVDIVNRLALGYPQIAITLVNNGHVLLETAGNGHLRQTVANIYGRHIAQGMHAFQAKDPDFEISGLASSPEMTRANRHFISLLLNGRYVRNFQLNQAVITGYGSNLRERRFPIAVVAIKLDPLLVDVNVHPTKQEVRLSKEKALCHLITQTIASILVDQSSVEAMVNLKDTHAASNLDQLEFNLNKNVVDSTRLRIDETSAVKDYTAPTSEHGPMTNLALPRKDDRYILTATWAQNILCQQSLTPFDEPVAQDKQVIGRADAVLSQSLPELTLIGQMSDYLLASHDQDLYLIDQLAARRRLAYDQIMSHLKAPKQDQQQVLLTPLTLDFSNVDALKIKQHQLEIEQLGIFLEPFGAKTFLLRTYPTWLQKNVETQLREILDLYLNAQQADLTKFKQELAAMTAQKTVSRRFKLTMPQGSQLLTDLAQSRQPYRDALGHLVVVRLRQGDLAKMFKKND